MSTHTHGPDPVAVRRVRLLVRARWLGVLFGLLQTATYATLPYPPGVQEAAYAIVGLMAAANLVFEVLLRRLTADRDVRRLAAVMLVLDVMALSGLTWVFAFDTLSALFVILVLLPIEGAVLFGLGGALWTWAAVAALYTGREAFGTRYGNPFELESVTFRVGIIGLVALIVGQLVRDLVAQREATAAALADAERAESSRSRLVSVLAHDVRAPIAAARSALDTLRVGEGHLDAARRLQVIEAGRRQADRALLLARDLLDLARAESGTLEVDRVPVDMRDLVDQVVSLLAGSVDVRTDVAAVHAAADPARLEQVLFNLLENAGKYGRPPFEVSAVRAGDEVELVVRDHGDGVPGEVDLFAPFAHAGEGSVGLGMWIVRQLTEAMGGTVEHRHADPGAAFVVRLPSAAADDVFGRLPAT